MAATDNALGYVPHPEEIFVDKKGNINPLAILALRDVVDAISYAINGRVSMGDTAAGSRAGNIDAVYATVVSPSVANTEFPVKHQLSRIPVGFDVVMLDKPGIVYASRKDSWSMSVIYLKCSSATTTLRLRLY